MNYEEFKREVTNFFIMINEIVLNDYSDKLSEEKLNEIRNFNANNIIFDNNIQTNTEKNKLYINNSYFLKDGLYDISKFENLKKQFIEKYFEKFIVFDYDKDTSSLMMKFAVENETNKFISKHNLDIVKTDNYQNEYILILIKNKAGIHYNELMYKMDVNTLINSLNDENIKKEYLKLENKQKKDDVEKKDELEKIAQIYGIDLTDIEVINIKKKKYYKLKKDNHYSMIEANTNYSIVEDFKNYQEESNDYQTANSKENAVNIASSMLNHKIEVKLIPINELHNYGDILSTLSIEQKNCVRTLFLNKEKCNIALINIYDGLAIDNFGKCIFAEKNNETGQYEIKYAQTNIYNDLETKSSSENETNINNNDNNFSNDNIDDFSGNNIDNSIESTTDNPTEIQKKETKGFQKKLTFSKKYSSQSGFVDALILSLIVGFISGASVGILLILMK